VTAEWRLRPYRRARVLTGALAVVGFGLLSVLEPLAWPVVVAALLFLAVSVLELRSGFSNPNLLVLLDTVIVFGVVAVARPFPGAEAAALALAMSSAVVFATSGLLRFLLPVLAALAAVLGVVNWVVRVPVEWATGGMVGNAVVASIALAPVLFWMGASISRAMPNGSLISSLVPNAGEFANALTERSSEGIAVIDFESKIRYANQAFAAIFGHDRDELLGASMSLLMDAETFRRHDAAVQRALLSRAPVEASNLELVGRHRDGRPVTALVSMSELSGEGERLVLGAVRDVSDMAELRSRLQELVASKDEFIATVAHELRTPLTAVLAFSEMLLDGAGTAERDEFLELIVDQSREMGYLIEDLLVAARVDGDAMTVSVEPTHLHAEVTAALGPWARHPQLELDHDALSRTVVADPGRLRQVLRNLVSNAVKHGGPHIAVTATADEPGRCHIVVRDDGPGVPHDREAAIFDPYVHGRDTPDQPSSAGLGLHVSRRLVELMNGTLDYRRAGGHTEFVMTLPLVEDVTTR
jgi:PAS domain S-box-containing protein